MQWEEIRSYTDWQKAFKNYKKLTKVTIGNKVNTIGNEAFSGCVKLSRVTIGTDIKKIGTKAFYKDKKLSSMIIKSSKLKSIGKQAIKGINGKVKIKVPKKKLATYKKLFKSKVGYTKTMKILK